MEIILSRKITLSHDELYKILSGDLHFEWGSLYFKTSDCNFEVINEVDIITNGSIKSEEILEEILIDKVIEFSRKNKEIKYNGHNEEIELFFYPDSLAPEFKSNIKALCSIVINEKD